MTTTIATIERGTMTRVLSWVRGAALTAAMATLVAPSLASAQVRMTVPPQSEPVALTGATIHTVTSGVIENGTIVFENGVITAVGANVTIPTGARVVDANGKHIYPGLIDAYSTVGISEIGAVGMSNDVPPGSQSGSMNVRATRASVMTAPFWSRTLTVTP